MITANSARPGSWRYASSWRTISFPEPTCLLVSAKTRTPCLGADQKTRGLWERDWLANYHLISNACSWNNCLHAYIHTLYQLSVAFIAAAESQPNFTPRNRSTFSPTLSSSEISNLFELSFLNCCTIWYAILFACDDSLSDHLSGGSWWYIR